MTIYYRDKGGVISAELTDGESGKSIDFCDGYAYFATEDQGGELLDKKIPLSAVVRIERQGGLTMDYLDLLDEIDEFRRNHQNEKRDPSDFCMRAIEAIIARRAGYSSRADWTDSLKSTKSRYARDLAKNPITF